MRSEDVTVRLGPTTYTVDAAFRFFNSGSTWPLAVGFPKRGMGYYDAFKGTSDFVSFQTWVNGKPVRFSEKVDSASIEGCGEFLSGLIDDIKHDNAGSCFAKDFRWLVKTVDFPANTITVTRVRYEAAYHDIGVCKIALYLYGTGAYWEGPIGQATFTVDSGGLPKDEQVSVNFPRRAANKYAVVKREISPGVISYRIENFEPDKEDELAISASPCP